MISFLKNCIDGLDAKNKGLAYFYDMSKAFDTISYNALLDKLFYYGFDQSSLALIKSYLSDRLQSVYYNNGFPLYLPVQSGFPQGSI